MFNNDNNEMHKILYINNYLVLLQQKFNYNSKRMLKEKNL